MSVFFCELDACFEKEKAKKVRLLLSLVSQFAAATICQPKKEEEEEEKMKKSKEQSCLFFLGTKE
jgi:hypothetical protein